MENIAAGDRVASFTLPTSSQTLAKARTRAAAAAALTAVLVLAVLFRLWGLFHDLPFSYFGDELHFMKRSAALGTGDLNPHWFHKPALLMYALAFADGLYYAAGRLFGWFGSTAEFGAHFLTDGAPFLLLGRLVVFACGVATVFAVYRIARRVFETGYAAFSAGLVAAVMAPMVASSQTIKSDVPCGLLITLSVWAYLGTRADDRLRPLVLASLLAGAAMGTHYYGIVLVPTYLVLELLEVRRGRRGHRDVRTAIVRCALVVGLFTLGFFVTSPYNFLDPTWIRGNLAHVTKTFRPSSQQVVFEPDSGVEFKPGAHAWGGAAVAFLAMASEPDSLGIGLAVLAILGLVETLRRRETRWYGLLVLIPSLAFFLAAITVAAYHAQPRHLNAVYPLLATLVWPGALLLVRLVPVVRHRPHAAAVSAMALAVLAALPSAAESARTNLEITRLDSRLVAYRWALQSLPRDSRILVDDYGPVLQPDPAAVARQWAILAGLPPGPFTDHQGTRLDLLRRFPPRDGRNIDELGHPWWLSREKTDEELRRDPADLDMGSPLVSRVPRTLAEYRGQGIRYVITNTDARDTYFDPKMNRSAGFPSFVRFYNELKRLEPVKTFDPAAWHGKGPVIWVYDLAQPASGPS
jgi:Dolichyl-phosphate-mannose-protein mannosyltransferase